MQSVFEELRRRNIFRVAGAYAVVGWLIIQLGIALETSLNLPGWFDTLFTTLVLIGFPVALVLAWAFELTPEGIRPTETVPDGKSIAKSTGRKLEIAIALGVLAILALAVIDLRRSTAPADPIPQAVTPGSTVTPVPQTGSASVAVMPFEDYSPGADQAYFANGISEELLNVLARVKGLRVASRTSAFALRDQDLAVSAIGAALGVSHVLEGSVRTSGDTLRITAQLIDTATDDHLWSDTYDRPLTADNIFDIQDEIAAAIVTELRSRLAVGASPQPAARTDSTEAYRLYLRARENMNLRTPDSLRTALGQFQETLQLDADYVPAMAGLADTYLLLIENAGLDRDTTLDLARLWVDRALALDPGSAEALTAAASLAYYSFDSDTTLDYAERAIAVNPNYVLAHHRKGMALSNRTRESLAAFKTALELDPLSGVLLVNTGFRQLALGEFDDARVTATNAIRWNPDYPYGYHILAELEVNAGEYASAHRLLQTALSKNPSAQLSRSRLAQFYINIGDLDRARDYAADTLTQAILHTIDGHPDRVRALIPDIGPSLKLDLACMIGDWQDCIDLSAPVVAEILAEGGPIETMEQVAVATQLVRAHDALGSTAPHRMRDRLAAYLDAKAAPDYTLQDVYSASVMHLVEGQPRLAFPLMTSALDQGHCVWQLEHDAVFAPFRDLPEFSAIIAENRENARAIREKVEAQLADPEPGWVGDQGR